MSQIPKEPDINKLRNLMSVVYDTQAKDNEVQSVIAWQNFVSKVAPSLVSLQTPSMPPDEKNEIKSATFCIAFLEFVS